MQIVTTFRDIEPEDGKPAQEGLDRNVERTADVAVGELVRRSHVDDLDLLSAHQAIVQLLRRDLGDPTER